METKARRRQGSIRGSAPRGSARRGSAPPGLPGRGNSYQAPWFSGAGQCSRSELAPASELARAGGSRAATLSYGVPSLASSAALGAAATGDAQARAGGGAGPQS